MHNGHPVAYFDGPGGTQVPRVVVAAMDDYLFHHNANTHWRYPTSEETDALIAARAKRLPISSTAAPDEIVFGHNMTTLTFHLARALGARAGEGRRDRRHRARSPRQRRALARARKGARRHRAHGADAHRRRHASTGIDLEPAITPRTKLVAIGAASNALGTITDVRARRARARRRRVASSSTPCTTRRTRSSTCSRIGCDFLALFGVQVLRSAHRHPVGQARR